MHFRRPFFKQRPTLYFDENFPAPLFSEFSDSSFWKKKYKFIHGGLIFTGKSDDFHASYCRKNGYVLVTLDPDFGNNRTYPFNGIPGAIIIRIGKNNASSIREGLSDVLKFISFFPRPKTFLGDSKFIVGPSSCVLVARDAETREIKKYHIRSGTTVGDVAQYFSY